MSENVRVAVVQLCVDDRLSHPKIRDQVRAKVRSIYLDADRIYLVNEIGGNFGENFRNTVEVVLQQGSEIVFCAMLHHDDCVAAAAGRRLPLERSLFDLSAYLAENGVVCPVYTGSILTATSDVTW